MKASSINCQTENKFALSTEYIHSSKTSLVVADIYPGPVCLAVAGHLQFTVWGRDFLKSCGALQCLLLGKKLLPS